MTAPDPAAVALVTALEAAERAFSAAALDPAACVAAAARCTALRAQLAAEGIERRTWRWERGAAEAIEDRPTRRTVTKSV